MPPTKLHYNDKQCVAYHVFLLCCIRDVIRRQFTSSVTVNMAWRTRMIWKTRKWTLKVTHDPCDPLNI